MSIFYSHSNHKDTSDDTFHKISKKIKNIIDTDNSDINNFNKLNRYANIHTIRYEDSVDIIGDFLGKIKPINPTPEMLGQIIKDGHGNFGYIPLFC
jgi:hypothetical protein